MGVDVVRTATEAEPIDYLYVLTPFFLTIVSHTTMHQRQKHPQNLQPLLALFLLPNAHYLVWWCIRGKLLQQGALFLQSEINVKLCTAFVLTIQ